MNDHRYKVGDVVKLRSNGPRMTIQSILSPSVLEPDQSEKRYHCQWFTGHKLDKLDDATFSEDSLEPAKIDT
jgi:uncharacterized protein YodC (DUF2158 family)